MRLLRVVGKNPLALCVYIVSQQHMLSSHCRGPHGSASSSSTWNAGAAHGGQQHPITRPWQQQHSHRAILHYIRGRVCWLVGFVLCMGALHCVFCTQHVVSTTTTSNLRAHTQAGFGNYVKVVGSHEQLGAWDPRAAPTMEWGEGEKWTTAIQVCVLYVCVFCVCVCACCCYAACAVGMHMHNKVLLHTPHFNTPPVFNNTSYMLPHTHPHPPSSPHTSPHLPTHAPTPHPHRLQREVGKWNTNSS